MQSKYDVVVVGGGPAGSMAAYSAAKAGMSVLMLEKDRDIGLPVRCAEGVAEKSLKGLVEIDPRWIAQKISAFYLYSPSGKRVELNYGDEGYILNRKVFDYDLAHRAARQGANVRTKAYVFDLLREDGRVSGVRVSHLDRTFEIQARVVIGADGVESRVGRWAGIKTRTLLKDMETCAQVTAANIDLEPTACHFFFGRQIAPEGYLWVFPRGNGTANIGVGISGAMAKIKSPLSYLEEYLSAHFPDAAILTTVVGGVPCAPTLDQIVADGLMLAGDAAHQANPLSGGGISSGMLAGKLAGETAASAIKANDVSAKRLKNYEKQWYRAEGNSNKLYYKIKNYTYKVTDNDLEEIADMVLKVPVEKRNMLALFRAALVKKPSLILDAIKLFT